MVISRVMESPESAQVLVLRKAALPPPLPLWTPHCLMLLEVCHLLPLSVCLNATCAIVGDFLEFERVRSFVV